MNKKEFRYVHFEDTYNISQILKKEKILDCKWRGTVPGGDHTICSELLNVNDSRESFPVICEVKWSKDDNKNIYTDIITGEEYEQKNTYRNCPIVFDDSEIPYPKLKIDTIGYLATIEEVTKFLTSLSYVDAKCYKLAIRELKAIYNQAYNECLQARNSRKTMDARDNVALENAMKRVRTIANKH